jgi:hypothetical protein
VAQLIDPSLLMPADDFTAGLRALRDKYGPSKRLATFFVAGANPNFHQHLFRADFYETMNGTTQAQFLSDFIAGKVSAVGP